MKTSLLILTALLLAPLAKLQAAEPPPQPLGPPLANSLVAYWSFDKVSNAAFSDCASKIAELKCETRDLDAGKNLVKAEELKIAVQEDFTIYLRFYLGSEYFDMSKKQDATLFEWMGADTGKQKDRHFISFEVLSRPNVPDNRYLGFWVDNCFLNVSLLKIQPNQWHDAVLRVKKRQGQFFLDGEIRARKNLDREAVSQQNCKISDVIKSNYCRLGSNRRGELQFGGKTSCLAIWNSYLPDAQLMALSTTNELKTHWEKPADWGCNWAGFYNEDISVAEAYRRMYDDTVRFYQQALKEDVYFPRFHLTTPGFMTEPSMSSMKNDAYHIFPHAHISWQFLHYEEQHYWYHLMSPDLLQWKLMPFPLWTRPNAGNIVESAGTGICFPQPAALGFEKWVSTNADLADWRLDKRVKMPPAASGLVPTDPFVFRNNGRWYMIGGYAGMVDQHPEVRGIIELYRARDETLEQWEYVGEFYRGSGKRTVHHPQLYFVGDKVVMSSDLPIDEDVEYVLGRIENEKFVREGGGTYQFGYDFWRWGQTITEKSGRVLRWCLLTHQYTENLLVGDIVRRGWEHAYSLPRVVSQKNNRLTFAPAGEIAGLRQKSLFSARDLLVGAGQPLFPKLAGNTAQVEVRCLLKPGADSRSGIVLKAAEDDLIRFYYDSQESQLVLDFSQTIHGGAHPGLSAVLRTPLHLEPGEKLDLRLFFDHSIIEVYANGECTSGRWFPNDPGKIAVGLFSSGGKTVFSEADIWEMGAIWKAYQ